MAYINHRQFGAFTKYDENEDGSLTVYGVASTASRDGAGEIVTVEAMKAALPDYERFPAIREMHQPIAAGHAVEVYIDDEGATQIAAHVDDPGSVKKVKSGTLKGFSIGGRVLKRDPDDRTIITSMKLIEVSLVDSPCNPDAVITMWKADMSNYNPSGDEVVAEAKRMAEDAGSKRFKDFLYKAREGLIAKAVEADLGEDDAETEAEATAAAEEPEAAAEVVTAEPAAGPAAEAVEAEAAPDPVAALDAVIERAAAVVAPAETEAPAPFADLAKAAEALRLVQVENPLTKSLWQVGRLAEIMESFQCVAANIVYEANSEKDGSPQPAKAQEAMKTLGELLVMMATEEVAEAIAGLPECDPPVVVIFEGDDAVMLLANQIVDLVKADADLMEKAGARNSKSDAATIQAMHDDTVKLGAQCQSEAEKAAALATDNERLTKALGEATPRIEEITKGFETRVETMTAEMTELRKRLEQVESEPAAPKTLASTLRAVTKTEDVSPGAGGGTSALTADEFRKHLDTLPDQERGELLLRVALSNPQLVQTARAAA